MLKAKMEIAHLAPNQNGKNLNETKCCFIAVQVSNAVNVFLTHFLLWLARSCFNYYQHDQTASLN